VRLDEPVARGSAGLRGCARSVGVMVSLNDLADRPPRMLEDSEIIDLAGTVRHIDTPACTARVGGAGFVEETTRTLFCGDLFTHTVMDRRSRRRICRSGRKAEELFHASCLSPNSGSRYENSAAYPEDAGAHARLIV